MIDGFSLLRILHFFLINIHDELIILFNENHQIDHALC